MSAPALWGAVLAGGESRRFGASKALAELDGRPLVRHAADVLLAVCERVVVVTSDPDVAGAAGLEATPDRVAGKGPLAGLEAALSWAEDAGGRGVFVLGCDTPRMTPDAVRAVAGDGDRTAAAVGPGGAEPLCAWYPVELLPSVRAALDEDRLALQAFLQEVGFRPVDLAESLPGASTDILSNVNTPADLERLRARLPPIVSVIGWKDSGKTTVAVGLVAELVRRGIDAMAVKHGHGFRFDAEGTDSWRFRNEAGARRVVLAGPDDFAVMGGWTDGEPPLAEIVRRYASDAQIVVAEGFKREAVPKIEVYRSAAHAAPLFGSGEVRDEDYLAIVTDLGDLPASVPVLPLSDDDLSARLAGLVLEALRIA